MQTERDYSDCGDINIGPPMFPELSTSHDNTFL